jgi:hypothetical protein
VKFWSFFLINSGVSNFPPIFHSILEFHPPSSCNFQPPNRVNNLEFDGAFKRAIKVHIKKLQSEIELIFFAAM